MQAEHIPAQVLHSRAEVTAEARKFTQVLEETRAVQFANDADRGILGFVLVQLQHLLEDREEFIQIQEQESKMKNDGIDDEQSYEIKFL